MGHLPPLYSVIDQASLLSLASLGTAFGLLTGLYLGYLAVQGLAAFGYPLVYTFPFSGVLVTIAVGLLFGALAAVIPARHETGRTGGKRLLAL